MNYRFAMSLERHLRQSNVLCSNPPQNRLKNHMDRISSFEVVSTYWNEQNVYLMESPNHEATQT
jgi:hypothetical protein